MERIELIEKISRYYSESEQGYLHWGRDEEREGVYAVHCGFSIEGKRLTPLGEVKQLSRQLIAFAHVGDNAIVLDAGCGSGALSFELADGCKDTKVFGINIALSQLVSANRYKLRSGNDKVFFSAQDYHQTAFPSSLFDAVIFCESFTHSYDKKNLFQEVSRILKPNGRVVLSDIFIEKNPEKEEDQTMLEEVKEGWYLPSVISAQETKDLLIDAGFSDIVCRGCTENIFDYSRRIGQHTKQKIKEGNLGSEVIQLSRRAVVACSDALEQRLIGYYFICGTKPAINLC